jgi:outer membrane factor, OMF family
MFKVYGVLIPFFSLSMMATVSAAPMTKKPDSVCKNTNLKALEQSLLPDPTEQPETLPPNNALDIPQQSQAVTLQQMRSLSLTAAIRLALERNQDLRISQLQLERSCAQLKQARAINYPTLQVNGGISRTDDGTYEPQQRVYSSNTGSQVQQETTSALLQQQAIAQQDFQQQLQELQTRFQRSSNLVQRNTFQQQIQQLQRRTSGLATLPDPVDITPITASDVVLPLTSINTAGGRGGFFNASLALTYRILTGGQRGASINAAQKQVEFAILDVQRRMQQLRQTITSNYYDMQQTQALIGVADSAVKNNQENLRILQLGEMAGTRTKFEVLEAAVTLRDAQQNQIQANALYTIARRQLAQQLNLPNDVDITLPPTATATKAGQWSPTLEESIVLALNNRIELTQTQLQVQIAQFQKRVVLSQKRPQVQGFATFDVADDLEDKHFGNYGYSVGVQVSLDLFDGGSVRAQVKQLEATIANIYQQFNQFKESVRFEVEQAYYNLKANETNIGTANQSVTAAQEGLRLANLRLQAGVGTTLEVTRAQADLTQAQGNLVAATLGYNRSLEAIQRATGYINSGNTNSPGSTNP